MAPFYSHLVLTALCSPLLHLPGLVYMTNSIWQNDGKRVSYKRLQLTSWALSHLPTLSDHSLWGRQAAMLLTTLWRGPHGEEHRPLANSQQGTEAFQQLHEWPWNSPRFSSPIWTLRRPQPWPIARLQPLLQPQARNTQLNHSQIPKPLLLQEIMHVCYFKLLNFGGNLLMEQ